MRVKVYFDFRDWWIGYYRGPNHHYVCPLPTVVFRWNRRKKPIVSIDPGQFLGINYHVQASCPPDKAYFITPKDLNPQSIFESMDRLSGYGAPPAIYMHPNTKKYLDEVMNIEYKKAFEDKVSKIKSDVTFNNDGTVTFPIRTRRDPNDTD